MEENKNSKKKNRKYNEIMLKSAIESVLQSKLTLYMASKEFNVPWSTLKANVERVKEERKQGITQIRMLKVGRPFSLSANLEQSLLSYIIQMQELGFGLTVNQIRQIAFSLAETAECKHYFNKSKRCAGWNWWVSFKGRYGLSLRIPENLSSGRAICSNPTILADFYEKLEATLVNHNLLDCPDRIWNCDETGLMYVNKPTKSVTKIGKKYVYNRTYAEKGTTTTVLACINAAGHFIPPLVIFKGVRNIPGLSNGSLPNSLTRLSPKGWINADLFYEWLKFFDRNIPPTRPVMLIMDSHASHIAPKILDYAKSHQIILFTMPAHTSHILQPLDVGVFRPLKAAWRAELQNYKVNNPTSVPTRFDFHKFLTPVYEQCFTPTNIRAGFRKAGIYPINKNAVCSEAIAPSILSDQPVPTSQFSMEEIIIGQDYDVDIPQAEIIKTNYDPLSEGAINEKDASKPSIPSISSIAEAQIENSAPSETLQMECELEQVLNSMYNINTVTNNITIDDIPRPILQNKNKIEIHDILILPKWKPNIKTRQKRNVPKAQCLTPVATTSSTNVSLRHVRRTTFKKRRSKSERSANTTTKLKKTSKRKRQTNFSTIK
ncbi:unnamed protein product [Parnassius apollo]|uniref:(apollo) hypothetical protein n=1 Tax=Parnassius apollo TaxID=110799 RepID=A0A8S3Y5U7_PARAO|nr:unnamed protein product [Parnassius apollo]